MTPVLDVVVHAERAVVDGAERRASVGIVGGVIHVIDPEPGVYRVVQDVVLSDGVVLLPGLVDTHVHINHPVTTSVGALEHKRAAAEGNCCIEVGFWDGVVPDNIGPADVLADLVAAGCVGFKCFLSGSGNPAFPPLNAEQFRRALDLAGELDTVMLVHAESDSVLAGSAAVEGSSYLAFLNSRPDAAEVTAVEQVIDTVRCTGGRAHIVHVSSAESLPLIAAAEHGGLPVTAETCPHHLTFDVDEIPDGGTEFAACPAIRHGANRRHLWTALRDGVLDMIVSDHSPCAPHHGPAGDWAVYILAVDDYRRITHVRLALESDGGVARLRVYGDVIIDPMQLSDVTTEMSGVENGGIIVWSSDTFYSDARALIAPGRPQTMGDGWETRRRRDIGPETHDAVIIAPAAEADLQCIEVDTTWYVSNASTQVCVLGSRSRPDDGTSWWTVPFEEMVLKRTLLEPDAPRRFHVDARGITALRLQAYPDGEIARLRAWGRPAAAGWADIETRWAAA